ncbi:MAG: lipopolysaccharide heptosyltransferase family protein [Desulfuromonadales bacterium]|nr:MAG: lipopolysaccharide heptosyltransferase family protein [Desulfuromonadales bacterium]
MLNRILFIRRDNVGDLICTTPAIHAVRERYPQARIGILVNSYNADIVAGNPDIDTVYVYRKAKHVPGEGRLAVWWSNLQLLRGIRRERYDVAIACGSHSPTLAGYAGRTGAARRIGYVPAGGRNRWYTDPVAVCADPEHEVERVFRLVQTLGVTGEPSGMVLVPNSDEMARFAAFRQEQGRGAKRPLVAVAISARGAKKQWPLDKFITLLRHLEEAARCDLLLLWAPGPQSSPAFPGDDEAADQVIAACGPGLMAYPTKTLPSLVAALASADLVVSLDTGSLHMAAALGKPTVALMHEGNAPFWYPWQTRSMVLTATSVATIEVAEVLAALESLLPAGDARR